MKSFFIRSSAGLFLLAALPAVLAQGTAVTYQGQLQFNGVPATGVYDLQFSLFNASSSGAQQGPTLTVNDLGITNGLFTTALDFGNTFPGADRYLQIAVRLGASVGAYSTLSPRQPLTPAPYSIYATSAGGITGTLPSAQLPTNAALLDRAQTFTARQTFQARSTFNDRVGIGTNNPQQALHVAGAYLRVDGAGGEQVFLGGDGAGGDVEIGSSNPGVGAVALYNAASGNRMSLFAQNGFFNGVISGDGSGLTALAAGQLTGTVPDSRLSANVALRASGNLFTGNQSFSDRLFFGTQTRQMLNLWSDEYAIGVQSDTAYFRTAGEFSWYRGGAHHDDRGNPGLGGTSLMRLDGSGNLMPRGWLGIGTATPGAHLDVVAGQALGRFTSTNALFGSVLIFNNKSANSDYLGAINFETNGLTVGQIGYLANHRLVFGAGGSERMSLQAGLLTINGTGNERAFIGGGGNEVVIGSANAGVNTIRFGNLTEFPVRPMDCFARTFNPTSDRNAKQDFRSVETLAILRKVITMPISEWSYKGDVATRHLGPVAQDFQEAFGLGGSDKSIATVDADGVALAAIQGLNRKLESEVTELRSENDDLRQRLERLERKLSRDARE